MFCLFLKSSLDTWSSTHVAMSLAEKCLAVELCWPFLSISAPCFSLFQLVCEQGPPTLLPYKHVSLCDCRLLGPKLECLAP